MPSLALTPAPSKGRSSRDIYQRLEGRASPAQSPQFPEVTTSCSHFSCGILPSWPEEVEPTPPETPVAPPEEARVPGIDRF